MKKLLLGALVLVLTMGIASGALAQTVLKLAEVHVADYPTGLADTEFARLVEEKTAGRIKIELYFNGTLYASEKDSIEALQLGELAFSRVSASPVSNFVPSINAIQMPYLYKNAAHMWAVLNGEIGQGFLEGIEASPDAGLIGLCYYDAGSRCFYLTKEVHSVADMAGLKIRVQDNSMMKRMVELLGATPVTGIGPNEVYTAISSGVVDGAENNWPTYESKKDYEVAKYYILDQHTRVPEILLASKAALAGVSAEDMQIIRECAVAVQQYEIDEWAKREVAAQEVVKAAGTVVVELTPEAFAEFQVKMAPLYDEFAADYKDMIEAIKVIGEGF